MLCDGDITKRDLVLDNYTFEECEPYLKYRFKAIMLREGIMQALGIDDKDRKIKGASLKFCIACKRRNKNVICSKCPRTFEVNDGRRK